MITLNEGLVERNATRGVNFAVEGVTRVAKVLEGENDRVLSGVVKLDQLSVEQLCAELVLAERKTPNKLKLLVVRSCSINRLVEDLGIVRQ